MKPAGKAARQVERTGEVRCKSNLNIFDIREIFAYPYNSEGDMDKFPYGKRNFKTVEEAVVHIEQLEQRYQELKKRVKLLIDELDNKSYPETEDFPFSRAFRG